MNLPYSFKSTRLLVRKNAIRTIQNYRIVYNYDLRTNRQEYLIRYHSPILQRYTEKYSIVYKHEKERVETKYRILYNHDREKQHETKRYILKYRDTRATRVRTPYNIMYNFTGTKDVHTRRRYFIKYNSETYQRVKTTYRINYAHAEFYNVKTTYNIVYNYTGVDKLYTNVVFLRHLDDTDRYDVAVKLNTLGTTSIKEALLVFSNLGKYELVEWTVGTSKPYISFVDANHEDYEKLNELFTPFSNKSKGLGIVLIKDIDIENPVSLDTYENFDNNKQLNHSKSYFMSHNQDDMLDKLVNVSFGSYSSYQVPKSEYNKQYANHVQLKLTPLFRVGVDCCFSRKITKTNYVYCSPF